MVNNATFLTYFEEARVAYLGSLGIFNPLKKPAVSIVIQRTEVDYLAPVRMPDKVQIYIRSSDYNGKRFTFEYALWLPGREVLAAKGKSLTVSYDLDMGRAVAIPEGFLKAMQAFESQGKEGADAGTG
jgi:acyl-CoA thioester hydrolase